MNCALYRFDEDCEQIATRLVNDVRRYFAASFYDK